MNNFTLKDLTNKVIKNISDHIGFDIKELFAVSDHITIYGGAVRDSLAEKEINDIDILCMPDSAVKLSNFLKENHNFSILDLYDIDILKMYSELNLISEPWTLINNNKKIVQIIRPHYREYIENYKDNYFNILKNVDISCCGVFLEVQDNQIRLRESCKNGIIHCLTKTFEINHWAKLFNTRTDGRQRKLLSKGWKDLDLTPTIPFYINEIDNPIKIERLLKITSLEFKPEYEYKIWSPDEYKNNKKSINYDDLPF